MVHDLNSFNGSKARNLVDQGWEETYRALFGSAFVDTLAPHHLEAIKWHFEARLSFLRGIKPTYLAYFPIWPRGHGKSYIAERIIVVDAVMSVAYNAPGFALYIGREKTKIKEHIANIEALLTSSAVRRYAPELARVQVNEVTNQKRQWTASFLHTAGHYVVKGGSIESAQAGARIADTRVTLFVPDDLDGREQSPVIAEMRARRLATELLPMGQSNSLTFYAQNLIDRYSTMYRIHTQQVKILTDRKPTEPVPAVRNLVTEEVTVDGLIRDVFVSGESTWPQVWTKERIQTEIDREGLAAFLAECQHDLSDAHEGRVHKNYDDSVHAISHSEFAALFRRRDAWKDWFKIVANDWARTKTKYHANVAGYLAVSSANTEYPGLTFFIPRSYKADTAPADVAIDLLSLLTPYACGENGDRTTWQELVDQAWRRVNAERHFTSVSERIDFERNYYGKIIPKYSRQVLQAYNVRAGVMSHSEDKVREMLNEGFGFAMQPANPTKTEALEQIDAAMRVDYKLPHLFRPDKNGYTRWYVLCDDDLQAEPEMIDGVAVYPPKPFPENVRPDELHHDDLCRYQLYYRRFRPPVMTKLGENIDELEKMNDDIGQLLQMVYSKGLLSNVKLLPGEKEELTLPPKFRIGAIQAQKPELSEQEYSQALITRQARLTIPKILAGKKKPTTGIGRFKR